jgi:Tol biopolymer transport system component
MANQKDGDWFAALAHASQLLQRQPGDRSLRESRLAIVAAAVQHDPKDAAAWCARARLLLEAGELEEYRKSCAALATLAGDFHDETLTRRLAGTCLLAPAALPNLPPLLDAFKKSVSEQYPEDLRIHGGLLLRAGKAGEAVRRLEEARKGATETPFEDLLLALAFRELKQPDREKECLARAVLVLDRNRVGSAVAAVLGGFPSPLQTLVGLQLGGVPEVWERAADWQRRLELQALYREVLKLPPPHQTITKPSASLRAESPSSVESVAFSPDGHLLAAGTKNKTVHVWDLIKGTELKIVKGHQSFINTVAFSHDGTRLASSGGEDQTVKVWDVQTGKELLSLKGHGNWTAGVAFSPDDKLLATTGEDRTVKLWNAETGAELKTLKGHTSWLWGVAFSPSGDVLASASGDHTIKLWNVTTGAEIRTLTGHTDRVRNLAFSPDGKRLVSCGWDSTVRIWDADTGRELRTLKGHTGFTLNAAFSPDGEYVASCSTDRSVRLWEVATGQECVLFLGHGDGIAAVAFSPDGSRLASGSADQTIKVWDVPPELRRGK